MLLFPIVKLKQMKVRRVTGYTTMKVSYKTSQLNLTLNRTLKPWSHLADIEADLSRP